MGDIEARTIRKVMWRLMPFLFVCYFVAYLDRVNVGFAKLQMNAALGLSEAAYGFGAGLFFISYFLLEVPSNLALDRFGARLWIARIMFSWGRHLRSVRLHRPDFSGNRDLERMGVLHPPFPARHRRGGFLSRDHFLPNAVVPLGLPGPRGRAVHAGHPILVDRRRADLRGDAELVRRWTRRLAMALHPRSLAVDSSWPSGSSST